MNRNINALEEHLRNHFQKSNSSLLQIGLTYNNEDYCFNIMGTKTSDQELFGIGSVSKTIISTWLSKAISEKRIELEKSVTSYLDVYVKFRCPTIFELATHTSGYQYFVPYYKTIPTLMMHGFNKKNIYHGVTDDWLYRYIKNKKPYNNKKYRYADINYALLAKVIENIEKTPFTHVMTNFIKNEMGMSETFYANYSHSVNDDYSWIWNDGNPFIASGGVFTTMNDLIKYVKYQINHKESQQFAHSKYLKTNNKNILSGFSWISFEKSNYFWHIGGQGYYRSYVGFDNKRNVGLCILSTVDINIQHVGRIGSLLYRNIKRNPNQLVQFLESYTHNHNQ